MEYFWLIVGAFILLISPLVVWYSVGGILNEKAKVISRGNDKKPLDTNVI